MKLKFKLTFKRGPKVVSEVDGHEVDTGDLTVADCYERIIETEQFIEKLTGLRLHIEQVR